jgi:putative transposase
VLTELQNRGVKDIFIACVDGLSGLPEAIETVYPREPGAIVHGASDAQLTALRVLQAHAHRWQPTGIPIYSASTEAEAEFNLELKALEMGCALPNDQQVVASPTSHG